MLVLAQQAVSASSTTSTDPTGTDPSDPSGTVDPVDPMHPADPTNTYVQYVAWRPRVSPLIITLVDASDSGTDVSIASLPTMGTLHRITDDVMSDALQSYDIVNTSTAALVYQHTDVSVFPSVDKCVLETRPKRMHILFTVYERPRVGFIQPTNEDDYGTLFIENAIECGMDAVAATHPTRLPLGSNIVSVSYTRSLHNSNSSTIPHVDDAHPDTSIVYINQIDTDNVPISVQVYYHPHVIDYQPSLTSLSQIPTRIYSIRPIPSSFQLRTQSVPPVTATLTTTLDAHLVALQVFSFENRESITQGVYVLTGTLLDLYVLHITVHVEHGALIIPSVDMSSGSLLPRTVDATLNSYMYDPAHVLLPTSLSKFVSFGTLALGVSCCVAGGVIRYLLARPSIPGSRVKQDSTGQVNIGDASDEKDNSMYVKYTNSDCRMRIEKHINKLKAAYNEYLEVVAKNQLSSESIDPNTNNLLPPIQSIKKLVDGSCTPPLMKERLTKLVNVDTLTTLGNAVSLTNSTSPQYNYTLHNDYISDLTRGLDEAFPPPSTCIIL